MKITAYIISLVLITSCKTITSMSETSKPETWILIEDYEQTSKFPALGYTSGYITETGDTVIPLDKYPRCYTDSFIYYAIVLDEKRGLIGINKKGKKLFNAVWLGDATPVSESDGMIMITENGKYGYANNKGEIIIKPKFKCAASFYEGKAKVSNDCSEVNDEHLRWKINSWFYIDKKGNKIE